MPALAVAIVRFVDEHQPGFVECVLRDAANEQHVFVEKVPVVTTEDLWATSNYPRPGVIECVVLEQWEDSGGCSLVRVTTEQPWGVESTRGETEFVVLASQVVRSERDA
ncbi:MAG: hypothetical protein AB7I19_11420 [Planctomycetota bacterium]